jgi:hypothetical protein
MLKNIFPINLVTFAKIKANKALCGQNKILRKKSESSVLKKFLYADSRENRRNFHV